MKSHIFYSDACQDIEKKTLDFLNRHEDFLSARTVRSPRAVGDAIEGILGESFQEILGSYCQNYSANFARRAMADLAFKDKDDLYYVVDVKTHRADSKFNMPNLTSVERLSRFYEDDTNYFVLLLIKYGIEELSARVSKVHFAPIEFLGWDCLTVGALGWGQIQIANSNHITINYQYSRKQWMLELCEMMLEFYPKEMGKIEERIQYFEKVKRFWKDKDES
jgi:hypothetical protein